MKAYKNTGVTRQELRRGARRAPIIRCAICGKHSTRHNTAAHRISR